MAALECAGLSIVLCCFQTNRDCRPAEGTVPVRMFLSIQENSQTAVLLLVSIPKKKQYSSPWKDSIHFRTKGLFMLGCWGKVTQTESRAHHSPQVVR